MNAENKSSIPFSPKPVQTLGEQIAEQFVQALVNGSIKPNDKLPSEQILAEQFGVSRKTMRDALSDLREKGFIKSKQGKSGGSYICDFSYDQLVLALSKTISFKINIDETSLEDIEEVRKLIEVFCAGKIADAYKSGESNTKIFLEEKSPNSNFNKECDKFFNFHISIGDASKNVFLSQIISCIHLILSTVFASSFYPINAREDAYPEHLALYNAITSGDRKKAEAEMLSHILKTNKRIQEEIAKKYDCLDEI